MNKRLEIILLELGLIVTCVVLLFGDNIYEQVTGRSFFNNSSEESSQQLETPLPTVANETPLLSVQPSVTNSFQASAKSIGHRQIPDLGTSQLLLTTNQVAIGTADRLQDVIDLYNPPFTIFVIYGSIDVELSMYWGGWDLWENASESFIDEQINDKIQEVISSHPTDYDTRGYRVIKCYKKVDNCETILTYPTTSGSSNTTLSCLPTEYTFMGESLTSAPTFLPTATGATKIFTHCPPNLTIKYESITVDDELQKVELVCADGTIDIKDYFTPFTVANEELLHYRSSRIELRQNCRIDFTVKDTKGDKIGMQIKLSVP
jgi:hypothetical protein